jgi:hypothetical protein
MAYEGMDLIVHSQERGRRRGLVNPVMKFGFHKMRRICRLAEDLFASQEGLCFM